MTHDTFLFLLTTQKIEERTLLIIATNGLFITYLFIYYIIQFFLKNV